MLDFIKKGIQQRQLRNMLSKSRDKWIKNWEDIHTIGLVFTVGNSDQWNLIHRFITAQENQGKKVFLIGFQASNYQIDYIFSHTRTTICHEKEDFNFFQLPKEGVIDGFLSQHFDILIDSTIQPDFFGKYVTACSNADLKVGYSNSENQSNEGIMDMYDMAISGNEPMNFRNYIEQIVKYLLMVQKPESDNLTQGQQ